MSFYKSTSIAITTLLMAAGFYAVSSAHPQEGRLLPAVVQSGQLLQVPAPTAVGAPNGLSIYAQDSLFGKLSPISAAQKILRDSDSAEDKKKALETIREELDKQYDEFLSNNEKQLTKMESRLAKLRDQLKRRKTAKRRMVELELERIINEADGLVWPGKQDRRVGTPIAPFLRGPSVPFATSNPLFGTTKYTPLPPQAGLFPYATPSKKRDKPGAR